MICRRSYTHSNPETLKQLYISFVRPHLEYAVACKTNQWSWESSNVALHTCFKAWGESYDVLLQRSNLPSLYKCRKFSKLTSFKSSMAPFIFQMLQHLCTLDCGTRPQHHFKYHLPGLTPLNFIYFPDAILLWNRLPADLRICSSLPDFKHNIWTYL